MAVLWMVPIYSVTSWCSLVFPHAEGVLSAIRDIYEAYVVYTFIAFLIAILQDGEDVSSFLDRLTARVVQEENLYNRAVSDNARQRPTRHLLPPIACCYSSDRPASVCIKCRA